MQRSDILVGIIAKTDRFLSTKTILLFFFFLLSINQFAQINNKRYRLFIQFKDADNKTVYIKSYDHKGYNIIDSFKVSSPKMEIRLVIDEPKVLMLTCGNKNELFMINYGDNFIEWDLSSSQKLIYRKNHLNEIRLKYDSLVSDKTRIELANLMRFNDEQDKQILDSVFKIQKNILKKYEKETQKYILDYKQSFFSLFLLRHNYRTWEQDTVKTLFNSISKSIKIFPSAKPIDSLLRYKKEYLNIEKLTYINSEQESKKFDYYIIDFWGSWCKPCIVMIPELKTLFKSYENKNVQFISIAFEMTKDLSAFNDIVNRYQMPWPQAVVQKKSDTTSLIEDYFIFEFPTYMLLDKEYKILFKSSHYDAIDRIKKIIDVKSN